MKVLFVVANDKHTTQSCFVDGRKLGLVSEVTGYIELMRVVSPQCHCHLPYLLHCPVCVYTVMLSPSLSLFSLVFLHFSVYTIVICSFLLLSFISLFSESLLLPQILSLYVCFWLWCTSTNCCGTGIGFKWVRGKKTQRHLMNGFSLDCEVDPSLRTELFPFTWSFSYSSPIYILSSWFPYPQNNLRKLPKG